jgi:hypothetical protein
MEIIVKRVTRTAKSTVGELTIMGALFRCYTLEDQDRGLNNKMPVDEIQKAKVFGETAIPSGRYQLTIDFSPHFGHDMPHILNVPDYDGVRIHPGNVPADTLGCILLGKDQGPDAVWNSREAFAEFYPLLQQAISRGETVYLTIV